MARPTLFTNRKFLKLTRTLGSDAAALGHLEFLWHAANETGDPVIGDADDVEALARWTGERGQLVAALMECGSGGGSGFIDRRDDGLYEIHDYWHHAPEYVNGRRGRENERKREKRCASCAAVYFSADPRSQFCSSACRSREYRHRNRDGCDTEASRTRHRNTDRHGTPAPAPAPAPAPKEKTKSPPSAAPAGASELWAEMLRLVLRWQRKTDSKRQVPCFKSEGTARAWIGSMLATGTWAEVGLRGEHLRVPAAGREAKLLAIIQAASDKQNPKSYTAGAVRNLVKRHHTMVHQI